MGQTTVAAVVHVQAVDGQKSLRVLRPAPSHHLETRHNRHVVAGSDVVDDLDEPFVARLVRRLQHHLRIDQHEGHVSGARRCDPGLHRGAEKLLVDTDNRVVGADLPDDEVRPARLQRRLQPLQRLDREFSANAGVADVGRNAVLMGKLVLETGRIGIGRRTCADALGRRRTDRQDVEGAVGAVVEVRQLRSGFRRRGRRAPRLVRARRRRCKEESEGGREPS